MENKLSRYSVPRVKRNLIGEQFGGFVVVSKLSNGYNGRVYWGCKCVTCGEDKIYRIRDDCLKKNSIGCQACVCRDNARNVKSGNLSNHWKGSKDISKTYFNRIKRHSRRRSRNLEFTVTINYLQNLLEKQNYRCALSNVSLVAHSNKKTSSTESTISLDRIDSSKGYIEGNVQWVHKSINTMKFNLDQEKFIQFCGMVWITHLASVGASSNTPQTKI